VIRDKTTQISLGYGFVRFVSEEDAATAIKSKNGFKIGHKLLKVSVARISSDNIRNCKVHVCNLPISYMERDVRNLFSEVGLIFVIYYL
jgi:RNA recognition motif-containing protein